MTIIKVATRATAQNGDFTCEADTEADSLVLRGHNGALLTFSLTIAAKDIPLVISVLGDAFDWRKHQMSGKG